jgi:hypothetical protein
MQAPLRKLAAPVLLKPVKKSRAFFQSNGKYLLIGTGAIVACALFYFLGFLFIQTIGLVAYVSLFPAIVIWERKNKVNGLREKEPSEDERWSKTKSELDKLQTQIEKTRNSSEKQSLLRKKVSLENELMKLEWEIRESDMTHIYNATRGLKPLSEKDISQNTAKDSETEANNSPLKFGKKTESNYLSDVLRNAKEILREEPENSREISLIQLANDVKAHYSILKRKTVPPKANLAPDSKEKSRSKSNNSTIPSDYWVCWATIQSLAKNSRFDRNLLKYASADFRPEFSKFLKSLSSNGNKNTLSSTDSSLGAL